MPFYGTAQIDAEHGNALVAGSDHALREVQPAEFRHMQYAPSSHTSDPQLSGISMAAAMELKWIFSDRGERFNRSGAISTSTGLPTMRKFSK